MQIFRPIGAVFKNQQKMLAKLQQHYTEASQSTKLIIIFQNAYKNHVIVSRTHKDIKQMIALLMLTQSLSHL
jgi:hypothetical protein